MENIYRIKCGELINIRAKFTEFKNELCPTSVAHLPQTYEDVKELLDIRSGAEEELLEDSISLNNLAQPDDIPIFDVNLHDLHAKPGQKSIEIPKKAMRLRCMRHRVEENSVRYHTNIPRKYNRYRYIEHKIDNTDESCDLVPLEEILITVRVYEPFVYKRGEGTARKPRLSQEFVVLGRQELTELRDKIYCHCQFGPFKDISNDFESIKNQETEPPEETNTNREDDFGFFFIADTFYNDDRTTKTDYTKEIREWMSRRDDIGPAQVKSMQNVKFEDLNVRVGYPQLYRHYVNCEHIISFTDIRLLAPDDSLKSTDYPLLRCVSSSKMTLCQVCGIIEATFTVKKSNAHIQDPVFLCRNCLISFHYIDGKKVGNFQAFRYYGNRPIIH
ncbi:snRNA-activating protein complex subunit 3 [Sitodiplosis mosellana]|uniref:snRNA-activating protein complex subunit 3 n=1 Tax=Sitodiplosis mosellana TaxID=263140 RepID=UPI002444D13B|nr:snRNA-activating protein complex subunit 3 [Sitodiplosis mosellana]